MRNSNVIDEQFDLEDDYIVPEESESSYENLYESEDSTAIEDVKKSDTDSDNNEDDEADNMDDVDLKISNNNRSRNMTKEEYNLLQKELDEKVKEFNDLSVRLDKAREAGDLRENTAFQDLSERVSGIAEDIKVLKHRIRYANIINTDDSSNAIGLGSKVNIVVSDPSGRMPNEVIDVIVVSEGFGRIDDNGTVMMPENSEVYRKMKDKTDGEFKLTGTDGITYDYVFKLIAG